MEYLNDAMKDVCIFIIITTTINNLLQGSVYKRYVKAVTGLMITLLIIHPVMELMSVGEDYVSAIDRYTARLDSDEMRQDIKMYADNKNEAYYIDILDITLADYLKTKGYSLVSSNWKLMLEENSADYGSIESLRIRIKSEGAQTVGGVHIDDNGQIEIYDRELVRDIADYFGIDELSVDITID